MKNILVLELQDGYYTQEKIDPKSIPDLVIPVIRKEVIIHQFLIIIMHFILKL